MQRYRASGRIPFGGLISLILAAIIGSLVVGGLVFAVSHLIYLIVLFPILMGAIGGAILAFAVKSGKVRSPIIAGLIGLIMGVGIVGVYRFAEYYIDFRNEIMVIVREDAGEGVPQEEVDQFIDESLLEEVGSPGFIGYLKYAATLGTTITRSSSEITLDENATWAYWGLELLIVALFCAGMAFNAARKPFNEEAGEWYPDPQYVGSVDWKSRKEFYNLLKDGDTRQAFKMVSSSPLTPPRVDVVVQQTLNAPQTDVILTVRETRLNRKQETSGDKMKGVLSPQEFTDLSRTVNAVQQPQPASMQFSGAANSLE
jgi:hypothetical protein